ncbi:MAG: hypothetical protein JSV86_19620 [Gemmatimonadota bacterium]|nr:MAG: hypothetical protein JSV86_19620 [Gemmatimonadota bacterium]
MTTSQRVPVAICQRRLATVWFSAGAVLFLLLAVQSLLGKYGDETTKAWSWLLPTIVPTLSLIIGAVAYQAKKAQSEATVDRFAYRLSLWLSVFYLVLVLATVIVPAVRSYPSAADMLGTMEMSNLFLGPVQGLVGIALGVFFVSRETVPRGP